MSLTESIVSLCVCDVSLRRHSDDPGVRIGRFIGLYYQCRCLKFPADCRLFI